MMSEKDKFMAAKMHEMKMKGVRRNTHKPVSASNPRRSVSHDQMVAIAMSEARRKGMMK